MPALWIVTGSCVAFVALVVLALVLLSNAYFDQFGSPALVRTIAFSIFALAWLTIGAGTTAAFQQRTREIHHRWREHARYKLTDHALIRHLPDEADIVIRFDEIVRLTETDDWLVVAASSGWRISIPRDVDRYDGLRSALARYATITPLRRSYGLWLVAVANLFLVVLCLFLMAESKEHAVRIGAAAVLVAVLTWQYLIFPLLSLRQRTRS